MEDRKLCSKSAAAAAPEVSQRGEIMKQFEIPEAAGDLIDFFFDAWEQQLIAKGADRIYTEKEIPRERLDIEYHRGVLSKADQTGDSYRLNNFYGFLDVFCVSRKEEYDTLSMQQKRTLDDWYFEAYFSGLDRTKDRPTPDRVIPLEDMLEEIDANPAQLYLNYCDCRSLTGECGYPTRTCLTYKNGINSFVDRGLSEPISKEKAKEIIRQADRIGLMHTTMGAGICNCCGDCCYLMRSQKKLGSIGVWPAAKYIALIDEAKCIACGKCEKRCHLGVFSLQRQQEGGREAAHNTRGKGKLSYDFAKCAGCGLCVNTCPGGALRLQVR